MSQHRRYPPVPPLRSALACTCPRCGEGRLFDGFLKVVERCDRCGLDLARHDSGDGPAVFLIFIISVIAVLAALWVESALAPPVWVHALIAGGLITALTLLMIRPAKAYVMALQYRHRRSDFEGS